ncbi:disulfide bond formation protein B [Candidatus Ichthyocystis hellenicum]|uniref:disulfide bond formation protein B n=1 Tax=Candidatus Ichthyocystis hellenicum TaxID=1561003 RepID=UPI000B8A0590|nr:disulfide bond formation protein B [Candidatus Ichthyocystis hellenicum]
MGPCARSCRPRALLFLGGVFSLVGLFFAYFMQEKLFLMPCPLCIIQRYFAFLVVFLSAFALVPCSCGHFVALVMGFLFAFSGLCVGVYQVYLHIFPSAVSHCSVELSNLVNKIFLAKWFPKMFYSAGDCAVIQWRLFDVITIPEISVAFFLSIVVLLGSGIFYAICARSCSGGDKSSGCHYS